LGDVWGDVMLARLVGIILGLILATSGYVVAGWGSLGSWATHLDLGPFEPHRPAAGAAAAIVGGVLIIAALLPDRKPKKRSAAPMAFGMDVEPQAQPVVALEAPVSISPAPARALRGERFAPSRSPRASEASFPAHE